MKRIILSLLIMTMLFVSCRKEPIEPKHRESIVILFENDVHCAIEGYSKLAGLRDAIADTAWAAIVTSGDYLQGTVTGIISRGQYIVDIMRAIKYDAVGLGNHEFDFGIPRLQELFQGFDAPVICSNLFDMEGNRLYDAYTIRTYGNRRVAFVGVLTPETQLSSEHYAFYDTNGNQLYTLNQDQYTAQVQSAVDAARADGADYVVLLSHLGEDSWGNQFNSNDLIAATHGINAVLDAHTHSVIDTVITNSRGESVLLANTGTRFAHIGKLYIAPDGTMDITLLPMSTITEESSVVRDEVERVKQLVAGQVGEVFAYSQVPLLVTDGNGNRMVRKAETNAGDLVTDAIRNFTQADVSIINGGSIRVDLPPGALTYGDAISLMPFDDEVVKVQLSGQQIIEMLAFGTADLPYEHGDFPQLSGMRFTVNVSDHSISDVEIQQSDGSYLPIDPSATYTLGTVDYVVAGGGYGGVLSNNPILNRTQTIGREAVIQYIVTQLDGIVDQQYAQPQGRITIIQ